MTSYQFLIKSSYSTKHTLNCRKSNGKHNGVNIIKRIQTKIKHTIQTIENNDFFFEIVDFSLQLSAFG